MQSSNQLKRGRYIVYIDLLGFREKVKEKGPEEIFELINDILEDFNRWENLNGAFKTIHFSDSFIFYQDRKGYGDWAFLDAYAIASFLFSAILAKGIAARGTITFGEFYVGLDRSKKHQIYFGSGLIEAYETEKRENWIGITIQPSAWQPYEDHNEGIIEIMQSEKQWFIQNDVLLLNPFRRAMGWYEDFWVVGFPASYKEWDVPEFPNNIQALKFLNEEAESYREKGDFTGKNATKYFTTIKFIKSILGEDIYKWSLELANQH